MIAKNNRFYNVGFLTNSTFSNMESVNKFNTYDTKIFEVEENYNLTQNVGIFDIEIDYHE